MFNLFSFRQNHPAKPKALDPVCNMKIEQGDIISEISGKTYFFCSDHCKQQFDANPAQYV